MVVFDYETLKWKGECHAVAGVLNVSQPVDAVSTRYLRRSRTQPPEKTMKKLVYDICRSPRLRASNVCMFVISCKHPLLHVRICAMSCKISHNSHAAWRCATRAYLCDVVQNCLTASSMQPQAIMSLLGCSWRFANEHTHSSSAILSRARANAVHLTINYEPPRTGPRGMPFLITFCN